MDVRTTGLTQAEAEQRKVPSGMEIRRPAWRLFLRQFTNPVMIVLIIAALISLVVSDPVDSAIILVIILASGTLGFIQEYRADIAMAELLGQVHVHADVIRDGHEVEVPLEDVVPDDVVVLRAGDIVPADLQLLDSENLLVDESSITGEPNAVEKRSDTTAHTKADSAAGEASGLQAATLPPDALFFGSHVVSGTAHGLATAVGIDTRFGSVVQRIEQRDVRTRFEREMGAFGLLLARVVMVLVAVIVVISLALHRPVLESLMFALAVAVGITPQLLPAIVTVSLSLGAKRMAGERVLVKRLDAIEDIGGMTLLCCDKTGTLTAGVVTLDAALDVNGALDPRVLSLAAMNAGLQTGYPNALDAAILQRAPAPEADLLGEVPYDFERRRLSVLVSEPGAGDAGQPKLITKGAFASVMAVCDTYRPGAAATPEETKTLTAPDRARIVERFEKLSTQGFRVLAVASRPMPGAETAAVDDEQRMVLEGLLAFMDPPTAQARAAVEELRQLGVDLALITGDNELVARHVADRVGLPTDQVMTGAQVEALNERQLAAAVASTRIFAAVDPLQKEQIVQAFQASGASVGFLGDGINDAAALRTADAGISVEDAADVAKHAAAIVVMTKDLGVIADGIRMGRATLSNTLKYIRVTISANFGNMVSLVVASAFLPFLPLLPGQILLLNLLSDVPALTIASDRVDPEEERSPRMWDLHALRGFMIAFGLVSSVIDLSLFTILELHFRAPAGEFRSSWFMLSLITECLALLVLRTGRPFWRSRPSTALLVASAVVVAIGIALPFVGVGTLLGLQPLPAALIGLVAGLAAAYVVLNEVAKAWWGRRRGWLSV